MRYSEGTTLQVAESIRALHTSNEIVLSRVEPDGNLHLPHGNYILKIKEQRCLGRWLHRAELKRAELKRARDNDDASASGSSASAIKAAPAMKLADVQAKLLTVKELRDTEVITPDEYTAKKDDTPSGNQGGT